MARIRSIHPALFTDEAFAGLSMGARVLLLGLWTEADDQGVFDWKPITLKMRIMPVDNVDVPALLLELEGADVIRRFSQGDKNFGAVRNFCKFQKPKTPKYRPISSEEVRKYVASSYPVSGVVEVEPASFPQSGEISPQREEGGGKREDEGVKESSPTPSAPSSSDAFKRFKAAYPRRDGANPWQPAEKKFNALVKTGVDPETMIRAASELAREEGARGNVGTKFIPQALTWLNQQRFQDYAAASFASSSDDGMVEVLGEDELAAWDAYARAQGRKSYPRNGRGGWRFPSRWPPGHRVAETEPVKLAFVPKLQTM
jgi:hypothetical protein